jgi:hypothetical protein
MNEYVFEVKLRAVVRVRAEDEETARKVIPTVLGAPGTLEINLANQNNVAVGRDATVTEVDFMQENDPRQLRAPATGSTAWTLLTSDPYLIASESLTRSRSWGLLLQNGAWPMREYEFEVTIVAVVRVRAGNEDRAREVVASSALDSPSPEEIRQANEALLDKGATIVAVDVAEPDEEAVRLISVEREQ